MTVPTPSSEDLALVERLRASDEAAFMTLVDQLQPAMLRVARMYVSTTAVAEEVVQDAWLGVLRALHSFEGRSSMRTWIFRILTNISKTRGQRESRSLPFDSLAGDDLDAPSVDPSRFERVRHAAAGRRCHDWAGIPEDRLLAHETLDVINRTIARLPPMQAEVIPTSRRPRMDVGGGP